MFPRQRSHMIFALICAFSNVNAFESTVGQDFVFGFINNWFGDGKLLAVVSNANDQPTNITITSLYPTFRTIYAVVQPNFIQTISITPVDIQARYADLCGSPTLIIEDKGIRIQSTLPITVYAHSQFSQTSSDSFTILPTVHLEKNYVAIGTICNSEMDCLATCPNAVMAVAYLDNTTITIGTQEITLDALEMITLAVNNITSGTMVSGSKPFAAFSGNMCGSMHTWDSGDYAMTTLLPTVHWGTLFPLVPFTHIDNQQYQIVANTDGTIVNADGQQYPLNAGQYLVLNVNGSTMLTSNYPVQLVQLGQTALGLRMNTTDELGGLFFLQIPSIDTWSNTVALFQPMGFFSSQETPLMVFIRIYTKAYGIGQIQMNNVTIDALQFMRIEQSDFYYYESEISSIDTYRISASNPNVTYSVLSYTYGLYSGSGFPITSCCTTIPAGPTISSTDTIVTTEIIATATSDVAATTTTNSFNVIILAVGISIVAIAILVLGCGCVCCMRARKVKDAKLQWYKRHRQIDTGQQERKMKKRSNDRHDEWEIDRKSLLIGDEKLGNGAFANVYKGTIVGRAPIMSIYTNLTLDLADNHVAIKMLQAHTDAGGKTNFLNEMAFMKRLGYHPHIVSLLGCVSDPEVPMLVVEYCVHGDMLRFLRKRKHSLLLQVSTGNMCPPHIDATEICLHPKDLVSFAWQISDGMDYLCSRHFIHRDLAARNILITHKLSAKICDFGFSRYTNEDFYRTKYLELPIKWLALESIKHWSFGVLLYELFTMGDTPYPTVQPSDMIEYLESGKRLPKPESLCSSEIYDLMQSCWNVDANERPQFADIRQELATILENISDNYGYYLQFIAENEENLKIEITEL